MKKRGKKISLGEKRKFTPDFTSLNRNAQLLRSKLLLRIAMEKKNMQVLAEEGRKTIEEAINKIEKTKKLSPEALRILNKFTLLKGLRLEYLKREEYDRSELYAAVALGIIPIKDVIEYCKDKKTINLYILMMLKELLNY